MRGPCKSCSHYKPIPDQKGPVQQKCCTRYPPTPVVIPMPGRLAGQMQISIQSVDPPTLPDHECGEWESQLTVAK